MWWKWINPDVFNKRRVIAGRLKQEDLKTETTWKGLGFVNSCLSLHTHARLNFSGSSDHLCNPEPHKANISQMPSFNMRLWLPDMERDILAPWRRVDNILWPGWGSVFLEHLMVITGDLAKGTCLHVMWRRGRHRSYDQDSTAGSCHSFDLQKLPPPQRNKTSRLGSMSCHFRDPPPQKKEDM